MTVTANDLYALGLAVGSLLRGHVDPARQDRVLDLIRTLERQAAGGAERVCGVCRIPLEPTETPGEYVHSGAEPGHAPVVSGRPS